MEHCWYMLPATEPLIRTVVINIYKDSPCGRKHAHQLLEGLEWLAKLETDVHFVYLFEIGGEGSKMVRIIPLP